ncbi:hypothetical protein XHV734_2730 [Xanthomonas hortorum pv. vitians]|nr:hypothetical protein XHV734_2730 [Xanthomonas hortorum pv. vitians]
MAKLRRRRPDEGGAPHPGGTGKRPTLPKLRAHDKHVRSMNDDNERLARNGRPRTTDGGCDAATAIGCLSRTLAGRSRVGRAIRATAGRCQ